MRKSIFFKMSVRFIILSMSIIIFMSIIVNNSFNREFESYIEEQNTAEIEEIVSEIGELYGEGEISADDTRSINRMINRAGYINSLEVSDLSGNAIYIYDRSTQSFQRGHMMMDTNGSSYDTVDYREGDLYIEVEYRGTAYLNPGDLEFKRSVQTTILIGGILLVLLSILISYFLSKSMSRPMRDISRAAEKIGDVDSEHIYKVRPKDSIEIEELSNAIEDVSKRLKDQGQLRQRLVSDMAHEIRTPISIIRGQLEAMIYGIWDMDKEKLEGLYEEITRLANMVGQLEDIQRLESKNQELNLDGVDLKVEIDHIVDSMSPIFSEKDIYVRSSLEPDLEVQADRDKFKQIIYNILNNAIKYSKEGSSIEIRSFKGSNYINIEIEDNGVGISDVDLKNIFERFYRGDKSRNREYGGLGLGLSIVYALVKLHGWYIEVESEEGIGTTFRVKIPIKS